MRKFCVQKRWILDYKMMKFAEKKKKNEAAATDEVFLLLKTMIFTHKLKVLC